MKVLLGIALGFVLQLHAQVAQVVGVIASDPEAREISPLLDIPENPAVFQVWRHGPTNGPLTVLLSVGGTASNGVDYEFISNSVTIPAGSYSTEVFVSVIDDPIVEGTETVVLTLQPSPCLACYEVGTNSTAVAYILDDEATNAPPIVWISRPHDGESFVGPTNILLRAVANDPEDGYDISVDFFSGDDRIGAATFIPSLCPAVDCPSWDLIWSNVPPGTYTLRAKATDKAGAMTVSAPVHITVISSGSPRIVMVTPHEGDRFPADTNIFLGANPFADAGVERVDFYDHDAFIGQGIGPLPSAIAAYGLTWSNPAVGLHTLLAVVTDGNGTRGTSAPVHVTILGSDGTNLPIVTVRAIAASTPEDEMLRGAPFPPIGFNIFRSGPTNDALTVHYEMGGSAINGVDYTALPGVVQIPAGRSNVSVVAHPIDDSLVEGSETVILRLTTGDCGPVPPSGASVSIAGQGTTGPGGWNLTILAQAGADGTNGHIEVLGGAAGPVLQVVPPHEGFDCWCINARRTDVIPDGPDYRENVYLRDTGDGVTAFDKFGLISSIGGDCNSFSIDDLAFLPLSQGNFEVVAADTDADGVPDYNDQCPGTAPGSAVDEHGCNAGEIITCGGYRVGDPGQATMLILDNDVASGPISLIPTGSVWKYNDQCVDLGTSWRGVDYNDAAWAAGPGQLGYGDGDEATVISSGADPTFKCITDYFRRQLVVTNAGAIANLRARLIYDDGAVVYLNGVEVFRVNMPDGPVSADTLAASLSEDNAVFTAEIDPARLVNGINVVAVEVHQVNVTSSDLSFDFELEANLSTSNRPPYVVFVTPHEGDVFSAGTGIFLGVDIFPNVPVARVDFYNGTNFIGQGIGPLPSPSGSYGLSWSNPPVGLDTLFAVATDTLGQRGTSAPVHITVVPTNTPPERTIVSVVALDPNAHEPGLATVIDGALFAIRRAGNLAFSIPVSFTLSGTASNGTDYLFISNRVVIPAGATQALVRVVPRHDDLPEGTESVVLTLQSPVCPAIFPPPPECYEVGTPAVAEVFIHDSLETNHPPVVQLNEPTDGSTFATPVDIVLRAYAQDVEDGNDLTVEFFAGTNRLGFGEFVPTLCPAPDCPFFAFTWSNVPPGNYTLTAKATDSLGAMTVSAPVRITVGATTNLAPTVAITVPTNGAVLPAGTDVHIEAVTKDPDGYTDTVEFFADDQRIGEVTVLFIQAPPPGSPVNFEFTWTNPPAGRHVLTATTVDAFGARGTSAPVRIFVGEETNRPPDYTVVTVVALDSHAQEPGIGAVDTGQFAIRRCGNLSNDVMVFFGVGGSASNGSDYIAISNRVVIPAGATQAVINIVPLADALVEGTETAVLELHPPVCAAVFPPPPGCYVVGSPGRATVFIADASAPTNRPPMVELVNPPDGSIFPAFADILLIAHANDPDGYETVRTVEFFAGSNSLGLRTNYPTANPIGPFFLIWSNVTAGEYALTARASDAAGASTLSSPIHMRVVDLTGTNRPSIWPWPRLRIPPQCLAEVRTNGCRLLLGADIPMTCVLESTVDLLHWTPLCTNTLSGGEIELRDCESGGASMRFYRVRQE